MTDRIVAIFVFVFVLFVASLAWTAFHFYGKTVSQEKELSQVKDDLSAAQFLVTSQATAAVAVNKTAGDSLNEQSVNKQDVIKTQVVIQKVLVSAPCSTVVVPAAASDSLLEKFSEISSGTANANTGKPAAAVPAKSATK